VRYYDIVITKKDGTPYQFKSLGNLSLCSLLPGGSQLPTTGVTNPAALQVEIDQGVANLANPDNQSAGITVWGLGLQDLGSAANLNDLNIAVYAGMAKGLPLANPAQAGLIVQGSIFQAFGNWIGTEQTLNLIITSNGSITGVPKPTNFPFSMPAGMPLGTAIQNTLKIAMPTVPVVLNVSPSLVVNHPRSGHYGSLDQFARAMKDISLGIVGGTVYQGVVIAPNGASLSVTDNVGANSQKNPTIIAWQDLIGQPTWVAPGTISFKTVLRADIKMSGYVSLPKTLFTQSSANNQYAGTPQTSLTFSGTFLITNVHHYGHSRQPDASAWNTTFQAVPATPSTSSSSGAAP